MTDNLNGAQVLGRIIRVDHCSKYVKREEEDDETLQQKREARGVCRAFQRGECTRGASCKFSHDEKVSLAYPSQSLILCELITWVVSVLAIDVAIDCYFSFIHILVFFIISRELPIPVGDMKRTEVPGGIMTSLMA